MSKPSRPAPVAPKRAPKPGIVKVYKALYPYTAQHSDELTFEEGDRLYISDQSEGGWWKGTVNGKSGLVPSNYVAADIEDSIDFPLHEAAKRGNVDFMLECLDNKIGLNGIDKSGSTALYWAAHGGHIECAQLLLDNSYINLNVQNKLGDTALHAAAWKGHADVARALIERGAALHVVNNDKKTAAALCRDAEVAALFRPVSHATAGSSDDYLGDSD